MAGLQKHARGWSHSPALIPGDTSERLFRQPIDNRGQRFARVSPFPRCFLIDRNLVVCACSIGDDFTRSLDFRDTVKPLGILPHQCNDLFQEISIWDALALAEINETTVDSLSLGKPAVFMHKHVRVDAPTLVVAPQA